MMRVAVLSGYSGPRSPMFANSAGDMFSLGSRSLGKSASDWYNQARSLVGQFDDLIVRTRKIANKPVREQLADEYIGSNPQNQDAGIYTRNGVAANIATAESYTPVNTILYDKREIQNRVQRLQSIVTDFNSAIVDAEKEWGSLPDPQVIETLKTVQVSTTPGWVPVVLIGAAGVAALAAYSYFTKK